MEFPHKELVETLMILIDWPPEHKLIVQLVILDFRVEV